MEGSRSRNALASSDFLDDFSRLTVRALKLRMYLVVAIIPYSDVVYHCADSKSWERLFFVEILKAIETSWDLKESSLEKPHFLVILLLQFFQDAIPDSFFSNRAIFLYDQCVDMLFNFSHTSNTYLELVGHLMCVCLHWNDDVLTEELIETADETIGLLIVYSAVVWMCKGEAAERNGDEKEATYCFDTAEECLQKFVPYNDSERMVYHFWFAIFLRSYGRTDEAIENLLISKDCENISVRLSSLDIHFLPKQLKNIIYDFTWRECRHDVTLPSRVIVGSLLVTYYVKLELTVDAKREALELWNEVRQSFKSNISFSDVLGMLDTQQNITISNHENEHDDEMLNEIDHLLGLRQNPRHPTNLPSLADCIRSILPIGTLGYFRRSGDILKFFINDLVKHGDEILMKSMMTSGESTMLDLIRHFVDGNGAVSPRKDKALYYVISGHALKEAGLEELAEEAFARSESVTKH